MVIPDRVALGLILLIVSGCHGSDYEIPLTDGYFIARVNPDDFALVAPDRHTVVVRTVRAYLVHGSIVAGQATISSRPEPLYFIVDTKMSSVATALTQSEWERRLSALGIQDRTLMRPKRPRVQNLVRSARDFETEVSKFRYRGSEG